MLPELDLVKDDVDRYFERKGYAAELDQDLNMTDILIDKAVFRMYDLTEDQIEIVEDAMMDSTED